MAIARLSCIMAVLPTHLVQELNVGTVCERVDEIICPAILLKADDHRLKNQLLSFRTCEL